jgi:peptide chain release factor 2
LPKYGPARATSSLGSTRSAGIFDADAKRARLDELEKLSAEPEFWNDADKAQRLLKERGDIANALETVDGPGQIVRDVLDMIDMAEAEGDASLLPDLQTQLDEVTAGLEKAEFARTMAAPTDKAVALVQINAGAGGTESADWAYMLLRMYSRWGEAHRMKVELVDELPGEEAGIKSAVLRIEGEYAFGWLKAENGVHRLVRISPFDSAKRRHTSFCSVYVVPEEDDSIAIDINESDLRIDTYRASGAGGQHVNRTDSAIRITHLPSGVVVACQAERSQHKNKSTAMKMLMARLIDLERKKRSAVKEEIEAAKMGINFGSQIRSYVLQPYQMVKDHRTQYQSSNTAGVLDGDLDAFMKAYLLAAATGHVAIQASDD